MQKNHWGNKAQKHWPELYTGYRKELQWNPKSLYRMDSEDMLKHGHVISLSSPIIKDIISFWSTMTHYILSLYFFCTILTLKIMRKKLFLLNISTLFSQWSLIPTCVWCQCWKHQSKPECCCESLQHSWKTHFRKSQLILNPLSFDWNSQGPLPPGASSNSESAHSRWGPQHRAGLSFS